IRTDRHPAAFLFLTAEGGVVDVNVSPAKTQVRFADAGTAYRLVYHALTSALPAGQGGGRFKPGRLAATIAAPGEPYGESVPGAPSRLTPTVTRVAVPPAPPPAPAEKRPPDIVPIGQHRESFIVASGPEGLLVIDQHAAHERILYERIRDRVASGRMLSQKLL